MRRTKSKGMHSKTRQLIVLQNKLVIECEVTLELIAIEAKIFESYVHRKKI